MFSSHWAKNSIRRLNSFSTIRLLTQEHRTFSVHNQNETKLYSKISKGFWAMNEMERSMEFLGKHQWESALSWLLEVQNILKSNNMQSSLEYIFVLINLANIYAKLLKSEEGDKIIFELKNLNDDQGIKSIEGSAFDIFANHYKILYLLENDPQRALEECVKSQEIHPESLQLKLDFANIKLIQENYSEADALYNEIINIEETKEKEDIQKYKFYALNNKAVGGQEYPLGGKENQSANVKLLLQGLIYEEKTFNSPKIREIIDSSAPLDSDTLLHIINGISSDNLGQILGNISCNMLLNKDQDVSLWLTIGLKYMETKSRYYLPRQLILIAKHYYNNEKYMHTEGLLRQAFELLCERENSYLHISCLNELILFLEKFPKREGELKKNKEIKETIQMDLKEFQKNIHKLYLGDENLLSKNYNIKDQILIQLL